MSQSNSVYPGNAPATLPHDTAFSRLVEQCHREITNATLRYYLVEKFEITLRYELLEVFEAGFKYYHNLILSKGSGITEIVSLWGVETELKVGLPQALSGVEYTMKIILKPLPVC
jgi:hypothetical protein